jgi:ethanolamine ammonia-lyase large subunit
MMGRNMHDKDEYKIEQIRVVSDLTEFSVESKTRDKNVKWTTRAMWAVVVFAIIGIVSVIKYVA